MTGDPRPDVETVRAVFDRAARAPSLHNSQPWRWRWDGTAAALYVDARPVAARDGHVQSGRHARLWGDAEPRRRRVERRGVGASASPRSRQLTVSSPTSPHSNLCARTCLPSRNCFSPRRSNGATPTGRRWHRPQIGW